MCYPDGLCLPRGVAARLGANLGTECSVVGPAEVGCAAGEPCRLGWCRGAVADGGADTDGGLVACTTGTLANAAPLFGGVTDAIVDGPDAVALRWLPAADETLPEAIDYLVFVATTPGGQDFTTPVGTVTGQTSIRLAGLTTGTTYYFVVRARDETGQTECNTRELAATPALPSSCVDYAAEVQPIFDANCTSCHSGALAPQGLHLTSYAEVLAGGLTGNEIVACSLLDSLLYLKVSLDNPPVGERMPRGGPYLLASQIDTLARWIEQGAGAACPVDPARCSDRTAPAFGGLVSATLSASGVGADLCWSAATDDTTATGAIVYDVYAAGAPGGQDFSGLPAETSPAGATCVHLDGLTPGAEYCWVVRARDATANRDTNAVERCLTIPAAPCIDYATVVQPIFDANCVRCHSGPLAPQGLRLDSRAGAIAGGTTGNEVVACRPLESLLFLKVTMDVPPVGRRMPWDGPPYLTTAQTDAIGQWLSEGARASCSDPDPCADAVAPTFGGLATATALDATRVELCWAPASDDVTPTTDIVYDVYQASSSGAQDFGSPPTVSSASGAGCTVVSALSPGASYCWVVRARDAAGNRDGNTVERCITLPALAPGCVDYATNIQPLLDRYCTRCHSGASPPQWLRLDGYDSVLAGGSRRVEVAACSPAASLIVGKISAAPPFGRRMPFDGPPFLTDAQVAMVSQWVANGAQRTCSEAATCGDSIDPAFAGAASATAIDATTIRVCWPAATDDRTLAASIRYDVYEAPTAGAERFADPPQSTVVGTICTDVRVGPGTSLCFVVRARDQVGNQDANRVEVCATTPAAGCALEYRETIQPILTARCAHCHTGTNPPRFLRLTSYADLLASGSLGNEVRACDWAGSFINAKTNGATCGRRMPFDGPPWLAPSERSLLEMWVQSGARESCADPDPCLDVTPPSFAGATSASAIDPTTVEVCWGPATDDTAPAGGITYEIYEAAAAGGEDFTRPASYAAPAGSSCTTIAVPSGATTCFVVRARDPRRNEDANLVERCVTTPAACVDYSRRVQPIFDARCVHCHSGPAAPRGIRWDTYANAVADSGEVRSCDPGGSNLNRMVEDCQMPQDTMADLCSWTACLTPSQQRLLREWVAQGAWPGCPPGGCR